jgi:hypothetical protein
MKRQERFIQLKARFCSLERAFLTPLSTEFSTEFTLTQPYNHRYLCQYLNHTYPCPAAIVPRLPMPAPSAQWIPRKK